MKSKNPERINCQGDKCKEKGCFTCGGYGYIAEYGVACSKCKKKAWFRPGAHTVYEGKTYTSLDGLHLKVTALAGENGHSVVMCSSCVS